MSRDLERLYTALADDADALAYPSPEALRQRVTSRSRVRAVTSFVAVVLVLGGVAFATTQLSSAQTPEPGSSQSPVPQVSSSEPSAEPSKSLAPSVPVEVPIPNSAFFEQPAETMGGVKPYAPQATSGLGGRPPLCGAEFASDSAVRAGGFREMHYYAPGVIGGAYGLPEGSVHQHIGVYESGAAKAAMQELRSAVGSCPEELDERTQGTLRYRLLSATARGDDSLLIEQVWVAPASMPKHLPVVRLYSVVRIGDVVTVLKVEGWEGLSADPAITDDYTQRAVSAITEWLG